MIAGWNAGPVPSRTGVGLRGVHHADWLEHRPECGWLEAHAENYFAVGGPLPALLDDLHRDYPLSIHGVGLGLGNAEPLDERHLQKLADLVLRHQPEVVSEHLCWTSHGSTHFNDLLPLPYTVECLQRLAARIDQLQERLGRQVLIEHLAQYVEFKESVLTEAQFLAELIQRTGCGLLLDLNNLHVNCCNLGGDARGFIDALPAAAVGEIHLAGHTEVRLQEAPLLIDTHGTKVAAAVWDLYRYTLHRLGPKPTLIEWDTDIPPLDSLLAQAALADAITATLQPGVLST